MFGWVLDSLNEIINILIDINNQEFLFVRQITYPSRKTIDVCAHRPTDQIGLATKVERGMARMAEGVACSCVELRVLRTGWCALRRWG